MQEGTTAKKERDEDLSKAIKSLVKLREWVEYMEEQLRKEAKRDGAINAVLVTVLVERLTPVVYNIGMVNGAILVERSDVVECHEDTNGEWVPHPAKPKSV
jgi:hypothetical protein